MTEERDVRERERETCFSLSSLSFPLRFFFLFAASLSRGVACREKKNEVTWMFHSFFLLFFYCY